MFDNIFGIETIYQRLAFGWGGVAATAARQRRYHPGLGRFWSWSALTPVELRKHETTNAEIRHDCGQIEWNGVRQHRNYISWRRKNVEPGMAVDKTRVFVCSRRIFRSVCTNRRCALLNIDDMAFQLRQIEMKIILSYSWAVSLR